jgi:hypothetical protein
MVYTGAIAACASVNTRSTSSELGAMSDAPLEVAEALVVGDAEDDEDAPCDGLGRGRHRDPHAVRALVGTARDGVRDARAEARLQLAALRPQRRQRSHHREHRLEQVDVNDLTRTAAIAVVQRDHHRERADERGDLVRQRDRRQQRATVGLAVERGEPTHRLGERREPRPRGVRAVLTEPGEAQDHEAGISREQVVGREAQPLECAGAQVLDEDVTAVDQGSHRGEPWIGLQVEHDGALVAADQLPEQGLAVARIPPPEAAGAVAVGSLDLDDVSTEVAEVAGGARSRDERRHVHHPDARERALHRQ